MIGKHEKGKFRKYEDMKKKEMKWRRGVQRMEKAD